MKAKGRFLITILCTLYSVLSFATSYTWNGTTSTAWATTTNWTPNGTPGSGDNVTVVSATNAPLYDGVAGVTNLTMTSGTLNLNGYTLTFTGAGVFNGGTISNGKINATGTSSNFAGTIFSCKVRAVVTNLYLNGSVFNDSTYVEQTGSNSNSGVGGNKYNAFTEVVNNGTGNLYLSYISPYRPDTANADIKFTKKNSGYLYPSRQGTGHQFNGKVILNATTGTSFLIIGQFATVQYNGDIELNNSGGTTIGIGGVSGGSQTLASGKKIIIGSGGFSSGTLTLEKFVQSGSTKQTFVLAGTSTLNLNTGSIFNAPVDIKAGATNLSGVWCKDTARIESTYIGCWGQGKNKFDGPATLVNNNSAASAGFAMGVTYPDTFNNTLSLIVTGASFSNITLARNSSGTYLAKNVTLKCKSTSGGIYLGSPSSSISTVYLKSGYKLITDTFNIGILSFAGFTQLGDTVQNIALTGSASMYFYGRSVFNARSYFEAPHIYLQGARFNKKCTFNKISSSSDVSAGGNVFNDTLVIINSTASGYFMMGNSAPDTCNGDVHLKNSASNHIYMNYNYPGVYNGNIYIAGAGAGNTYFGGNTGTGKLASGKTIIEDTDGFTAGSFILRNFTKNGTTAINLDIGNAAITFSTGNTINGPVTITSGAIYLNGTTFNGKVDLLKTGTTFTNSSGGNTYNSTFKMRVTGSGRVDLNTSTSVSDIYNDTARFVNEMSSTSGGVAQNFFVSRYSSNNQFNGAKTIYINNASINSGIYTSDYATTVFNSNIEVNNTSSGGGTIAFGSYQGNITLASGKTISVGSLGFDKGALHIRAFQQTGNTAQVITTTGTSLVAFLKPVNTPTIRSSFDGQITITSPSVYLSGAVFKDDASFTVTGSTTYNSDGDNEYQGDFTFNNTGSGNKTFANVTRDIYKSNATFISSSGTFYIAHKGINIFSGDITVNGSPSFYFGNGGGKVVMDGTGDHKVKKITGSVTRTFSLNKPGDYTSTFKNLLFTNDLMGRMWQPEN